MFDKPINIDGNTVYIFNECSIDENDLKMDVLQENYIDTPTGKLPIITIEATGQSFGVENWNKRFYDDFVVMDSLNGDGMIQNDIKRGQWCGEFGHPLDLDPRRQMIIFPQTSSHRILSYWQVGNLLKLKVRTLPYEWGYAMASNCLDGVPAAFSLRSLGSIDLATRHVKSPLKILTYDYVYRPSHKEAYQDRILSETANSIYIPEYGKGYGEIITESAVFESVSMNALHESAYDFVMERSVNVRKIADMFNLDTYAKSSLNETGDYLILDLDSENKARIPVESAIRMQYHSALNRFKK